MCTIMQNFTLIGTTVAEISVTGQRKYSNQYRRGRSPPKPLLAVPNVTARPSTTSVPITILPYNAPLLYGFNVPIKGKQKEVH